MGDPASPPESGMSCASCGAPLSGPWCAQCGQRVLKGRHTLRGFARTGLGHVLDVDRGFLHTAVRLTAAPGLAIREFIAGATERYSLEAPHSRAQVRPFTRSLTQLHRTGCLGTMPCSPARRSIVTGGTPR